MSPTQENPVRRRAPGMSQEDRRAMIIRAVLPLVVEHGTAITTSQIARAAGIGEGTIFRAFTDKDELFAACVQEALRPDGALEQIADIPLDQPLHRRLTEAAEALGAHLSRTGAVIAVAYAGGRPKHRPEHEANERSKTGDSRRESMLAIQRAISELFDPERDQLRATPDQLAQVFLGLLFHRQRALHEPEPLDTAAMVEVFLHGAVTAR